MKGLLLKDYYMTLKYCRAFFFIVIVFFGVSVLGGDNPFFAIYPIIIVSMIPVTLLSYDEKNKWTLYGETFPYTRGQLVSAKYIVTLIAVCCVWTLSVMAQAMSGIFSDNLQMGILEAAVMLAIGLVAPAVMLPIMFKFGTEKGRVFYYLMIILLCGGYASIAINGPERFIMNILSVPWFPCFLAAVCILIFALSWRLSIGFYRKREL